MLCVIDQIRILEAVMGLSARSAIPFDRYMSSEQSERMKEDLNFLLKQTDVFIPVPGSRGSDAPRSHSAPRFVVKT